MAVLQELVLAWTLPSGTASRTILHFGNTASPNANLAAVRAALEVFKPQLAATVTITYPVEVTYLDDATGALTGRDPITALAPTVGTSTATAQADALQGLIRFVTGHVVNGRFVVGRLFVPGMYSGAQLNGNVIPAAITALSALGNALAAAGLVIWHRPQGDPPSGGSQHPVTSGTGQPEFAVLRRRRNRITV